MISKEHFCSLLSAIQRQVDEDTAFATLASDYFGGRVGTSANVQLILTVVKYLDSTTECCSYVYSWVFECDFGRYTRGITDMSFELKGIHTNDDLYEFITKKIK
jgi:hypothetical protein